IYLSVLLQNYKYQTETVDDATWCSTLLLALLIPSLMWDHYLVMLLLPVAWMVKVCLHSGRFVFMAIVICCYGITCIPWNFEADSWRSGPGIPFMSLKLWPVLGLFGLSLCLIVLSGKGFLSPSNTAAELERPDKVEPEKTR